MSNMSYCRFQNTLEDVRDCYDHMDDELSEEEQLARDKLITLCRMIYVNEMLKADYNI